MHKQDHEHWQAQVESAMDSLTDTVSLAFLRELVDWAEVDPLLTRLVDVKQVRLDV